MYEEYKNGYNDGRNGKPRSIPDASIGSSIVNQYLSGYFAGKEDAILINQSPHRSVETEKF